MSEFDFEPVHGLPEHLPEGEVLRWQGAPKWRALAVRALHVRKVALYFGLLILLRFVLDLSAGRPLPDALMSASWLLSLGALAVGILTLLAWLYGRATVYSITDRRVVIRSGVAVPIAVNIPFKVIESAGLRRHGEGVGDIPMALSAGHKVNFLIMWPNVRPWHFFDAQPMLRCIPDVDKAADILATALQASVEAGERSDDDADPAAQAARPERNTPSMTPQPATGR